MEFLSPEVSVQELASTAINTPSTSPSTTFMLHTAKQGAINRPFTTISLADWVSIFGQDDGGFGYQSAVGYFQNGGRQLVCSRVAHYTNITNLATLTAVAAATTLNTESAAATSAAKVTTVPGPWNFGPLSPGVVPPLSIPLELIASIGGAGANTATVTAFAATVTAPGVPLGIGVAGSTLTFAMKATAGAAQNFVYTVPGSGMPTTAAEWALQISAAVPGSIGEVNAGVVRLRTENRGTLVDIDYVSATGTAGAQSGFGAGPVAGVAGGVSNVNFVNNVQPAELASIIQAAWVASSGVTAVAGVDGNISVTTVATGAAASIGAVSGNLSTIVGFTPAGLVNGTAAGAAAVPSLIFKATSEGVHGNNLAVTTLRKSRFGGTVTANVTSGVVTEFKIDNAARLRPGLQILVEDTVAVAKFRGVISAIIGTRVLMAGTVTATGNLLAVNNPTVTRETFDVTYVIDGTAQAPVLDLSMSTLDIQYFVERVLGSNPVNMDPRTRIYVDVQSAPISATQDPRPVDVLSQTLTGGLDSQPLVDLDWIGSLSTATGLYSMGKSRGHSIAIAPGYETQPFQKGQVDYSDFRKRFIALLDAPAGLTTASAVKTYVATTAALFTTYAAMYAGRIEILRESTGAQETFPAAAYIAGMFARNDLTDSVASAPAGTRKGRLYGVLDASNDNYYGEKANRDILYPDPGVNTIWRKDNAGVVAWGQLTLDPASDRGSIGVRRALLKIERDIELIADTVLFERNTMALRKSYVIKTDGYFTQIYRDGITVGDNVRKSYLTVCDETNNPPSVVNARRFCALHKVNLIPGIDYATIFVQRDSRTLEAELAAA